MAVRLNNQEKYERNIRDIRGKMESKNLNLNDDWEVRNVLFELCAQWIYIGEYYDRIYYGKTWRTGL